MEATKYPTHFEPETPVDSKETKYPSHFEVESKKEVVKKDLPKPEDDKNTITKEQFDKMSYNARNELYQKDKETYDRLVKEGNE